MAKLLCVGSCYMPTGEKSKKGKAGVEKFEDEFDDARDVYEVDDKRVEEFVATGNFRLVAE